MNYVHGLCFVVFCCGSVLVDSTHILQGYFTGTGAFIWLPQCLWSNPEGYGQTNHINSLAPGIFKLNFIQEIFKLISVIDGWRISCETVVRLMLLDLSDDKSTLVQVMAWCRQATSHYLSQCWPRSLSPYGVIRPQWVNLLKRIIQP